MDTLTEKYIKNHLNDDVFQLALGKKHPDIDIQFALRQISGYQNIKRKVPSFTEFEGLLYPTHISLEQCSSQSTAQFKALEISKLFPDNFSLLDLTCGFGVDAFFISKYAGHAVLLEQNKELADITKHNFSILNKNVEVINIDAEDFIKSNTKRFDVVFIDPARRGTKGEKVVLLEDCTPNILNLLPDIKKITDVLAIKLSPMFDIKQLIAKLPGIKNIYSIGVDNECKEIFVIMDFNSNEEKIIAVNISDNENKISLMESTLHAEDNTNILYTAELGKYIYEPYASFLKSGLFKTIANTYNVNKINVNSHLYTSSEYIEDFPGRKLEIVDMVEFNKKEAKRFFEKYKKANITVRNFPITVEMLRKSYKVNSGGENYVFATTIFPSTKVLINCKKI